jgi:hypothetical protein
MEFKVIQKIEKHERFDGTYMKSGKGNVNPVECFT